MSAFPVLFPLASAVVVLLLAGFAFGRVRAARPRTAGARTTPLIVLAVVAFPVVTLMFAKLFRSDVLGWIFGLTLIAGLALLPCVAIFCAGLWLGSRGTQGRSSPGNAASNRVVQVVRGSVHASDDAPSRQISVPPNMTLRAMVALAIGDRYLPKISGGRATWVVESSGVDGALRPIAVCAQQRSEVMFLTPAGVSVANHFGASLPHLHLRYRGQDDPDAVVAACEAAGW